MARKVSNAIIISDTHFGCRMSLCPPSGIALDDGGVYTPSKLQMKLWEWWVEFWEKWVPEATSGKPYCLIHAGDLINGKPHDAVTNISDNIADQGRVARDVMGPIVKKARGGFYLVRGTEAHVGKSAMFEEMLAEALGAIPDEEGRYGRWELWKKLAGHTAHVMHHIGTSSSTGYESSALMKEIEQTLVEAARWGYQPPSWVVRAHRHRNLEIRAPAKDTPIAGVITPAWQLKTPFTWKIAGARLAPPQIGGVLLRVTRGVPYVRSFVKDLERPKEEE